MKIEFLDTRGETLAAHVRRIAEPATGDSGPERALIVTCPEKARQELPSVIEHIPGFFYRCRYDSRWTMLLISGGCERITGYKADEIINNALVSYEEIIRPEVRDRIRDQWEYAVRENTLFELEYPIATKSGETKWVWERGWPVYGESKRVEYLEGLITDVTEKRETELALRESQQRYELLFEALEEGVLLTDLEYRIQLANPKAASVLGLESPEAAAGLNALDFLSAGDRKKVVKAREQLERSGRAEKFEVTVLRRNGAPVPVLLHAALLVDSTDRPYGIMAVGYDLTATKRAEKQRLSLLEKQKELERQGTISRLAGGIAHNFNNLLGVILGYTDILLEQKHLDTETQLQLQEIHEAAMRSAELTKQLLALSGKQISRPTTIGLKTFFDENAAYFQQLLGEQITCSVRVASCCPVISIDENQFTVIMQNLLSNARQALPSGGEVTVAVVQRETNVHVTVSDSGKGISPETIKHIYDPFFTTREIGSQAAGLGLSVVRGIVHQHGGSMHVRSTEGSGTSVTVVFPAKESSEPGKKN